MEKYKGYAARICWYEDDRLYFGQLSGISDLVVFHSKTINEMEAQFHAVVDDYLAFCGEVGKKPNHPNTEECCMTEIKINGIRYCYTDDTLPEIKDYLDMHADTVFEENRRPLDIPADFTEIHIDGFVYAFASIDEHLDELDYRAARVEEDK